MAPWLRRIIIVCAVLGACKWLVSLVIQLRPIITPRWARIFLDSHWRQAYRRPEHMLQGWGVTSGQRVLEIGPGTGLFTLPTAHLLGEQGLLLCLDVQMVMLRLLAPTILARNLRNVFLQAGTAEALPLQSASIDIVLAIAVLPMIGKKHQTLQEIRRVLMPQGVLIISEDVISPEYVPAWLTKRWCNKAGFVCVQHIHAVWGYALIFRSL